MKGMNNVQKALDTLQCAVNTGDNVCANRGKGLRCCKECNIEQSFLILQKYITDREPSKQVDNLIKCKACSHYERRNNYEGVGYCYFWDHETGKAPNSVFENDYCSYASVD